MLKKSLGALLIELREKRNSNQHGVAEAAGCTQKHLGDIERDQATPDPDLLLRLYLELVPEPARNESLLTTLLLLWVERKFEQDEESVHKKKREDDLGKLDQRIRQQTQEIIERLVGQQHAKSHRPHPAKLRSLANFPDDFLPLTIISGDRRRFRPRSRGDVFANSASITDLMFLPQLGLPKDCMIRTDKIFALMNEEQLKREFGRTNVLVIGSPMVNLAARAFNEHCIFRFAVAPEVKEVEQKLRHLSFGDNEHFRIFWQMAEDPLRIDLNDYQDLDVSPQELNELSEKVVEIFGRRTPSQYLAKFVGLEMVDPAAEVVTLERTEDNDFGILSLGRNPYAGNDDYVCIMAAGISALGTAQAVLSLARKSFDKHPFGGILEAITNDKPAPRDFEDAHSNWINREGYEPEKVVKNLEAALKQRSKDSSLNHLSLNEIEACLDFVLAMTGQSRNRK